MTELIFITSTGTDIGKTVVATSLIKKLRAEGKSVHAFKPIISGVNSTTITQSDTASILSALGRDITEENLKQISPWQFEDALSPHDAARNAGQEIIFSDLIDFCATALLNAQTQNIDYLIIEAVGGIMVPLNDQKTVLDWMKALNAPAVLVIGNYLGTLSHSLTAIEILKNRQIEILKVIISEKQAAPHEVSLKDTLTSLKNFHPDLIFEVCPFLPK